jgi:multidrug efflux system membrane fusion protein
VAAAQGLSPSALPSRVSATAGAVFLLAVLLSAGCNRHGKPAPQGGSTVPPSQARLKRPVELDRVRLEKLATFVETVGYLEAESHTELAAGISGIVENVLFREGQIVGPRDILVLIEQERYQAAVDLARANLVGAEAEERAAYKNKDITDTSMRAVTEKDRADALRDLEVARARVGAARASLRIAQNNLHRSRVRAPYPAQINQRKVTPGMHVEEKTVLATMADLRRLRLVGFVPEKMAPLVQEMVQREHQFHAAWLVGCWLGSPWAGLAAVHLDDLGESPSVYQIEFELRAYPRTTFTGRIFYLSTTANPETHMFECKAEVPRREHQDELRPGFSAKIRCPLPSNSASLVLPEEAVRATERGNIAFRPKPIRKPDGTIEGWVAEAITLEIGLRQPGFVEVLGIGRPGLVEVLKGFGHGDWIIRKGAEALEDNTPIQIPEEQEWELRKSFK